MHCLAGYEKSHSANESGKAVLSFTASVALKKKNAKKGVGVGGPVYNTCHVCGLCLSTNSLTKLYNVLVVYVLLVAMCTCLIISVLVYPQSKILLSKGIFL